jgi:SAM-dependent methyltransferase
MLSSATKRSGSSLRDHHRAPGEEPTVTDRIAEHYERLAPTYDEYWNYNPDYIKAFSSAIVGALRLNASDSIADVGCGTGLYSRQVCEDVRPTRPILCVDPVPAMLAQLPDVPGLRPVLARAEDLASGAVAVPDGGTLDAILLKESIHHMPDRAETLRGLASRLSPHGRILVVMLPRTIGHPLFGAAHDRFEALQPEPSAIAELLAEAGLRSAVNHRTFHAAVDRDRYVSMLEARYMSVLDEFSDDELAEGVRQFRRAYRDPGVIRFDDHFAFVTGWVRPAA